MTDKFGFNEPGLNVIQGVTNPQASKGFALPFGGTDLTGAIEFSAPTSATEKANMTGGATDVGGTPAIALDAVTATGSVLPVNWFVRGIVVILGFVFVAVGLSMFKGAVLSTIAKEAGG